MLEPDFWFSSRETRKWNFSIFLIFCIFSPLESNNINLWCLVVLIFFLRNIKMCLTQMWVLKIVSLRIGVFLWKKNLFVQVSRSQSSTPKCWDFFFFALPGTLLERAGGGGRALRYCSGGKGSRWLVKKMGGVNRYSICVCGSLIHKKKKSTTLLPVMVWWHGKEK